MFDNNLRFDSSLACAGAHEAQADLVGILFQLSMLGILGRQMKSV